MPFDIVLFPIWRIRSAHMEQWSNSCSIPFLKPYGCHWEANPGPAGVSLLH